MTSSLIQVIQLRMAPDSTPGAIGLAVTLPKVFIGDTPRLMDASSTPPRSICCRKALPDRTVWGNF